MMNGAIPMEPSGQQQMPSGHVPMELQSVPDGYVPTEQEEQPIVRFPLLQPPTHLEHFLQQQRGYVEEMFRRQHEVVQCQLAQIQQQHLEFMQRQGHILRNIVAAVNGQVTPHSEAPKSTSLSHVVGNDINAKEVRSVQQMDVYTASVGDRHKFVPIMNKMSSAQVNLDMGSVITETSAGTRSKIDNQPMSRSPSAAEAAVRMLPEEAGKFYYKMKVGGWTFVGMARVTREQLFGCGMIDGCGLLPVPKQGDTFKANVKKVESGCLSCVVNKLAADVAPVFWSMKGPASVKYRTLIRLKQNLAITERSLVIREKDEQLLGKHNLSSPDMKAELSTSQQLIQPKLAGLLRMSGLRDDLESLLAVQKNKAGRSTSKVIMQVYLMECEGVPNLQGVARAPPSEAILERIRTKLEFEPPPSLMSSALKQNVYRILLVMELSKQFNDNNWQWSIGVDYDRIGRVVINVRGNYRRQVQPDATAKPFSRADWDPGPASTLMPISLMLWETTQQPMSQVQVSMTGALGRRPVSAVPTTSSPRSTSPLQSTSTVRGRASSLQVPCCSSLS